MCSGCGVDGGRRAFLREAAAAAAAALLSVGLSPRAAQAVPIAGVAGSRREAGGVAYPIPTADGVQIDKPNEVILVRHAGIVYAFALSCPHQNTALRWNADEGRFQCPKHKSRYRPDGTFISGRATRNMDRLPIRRDGGSVIVDVERMFESDKDQTGWTGAAVKI
jgi:Rieske Fe-S protein